jgi:hypothetical protein
LIGAALLVTALVGGRWLAVETAERAWDQTFAGGTAVIAARDLARLLQALVLIVSITWITGNLLVVYRAIGSVQMPRRLGDLEIVEAVPQRALLGVTVLLGVVLGSLFALGTGDWWRHAVLAASPPHFGIPDGTKLARDVGYYVSVLPWMATLQNRALILVIEGVGVVTLLYAVIGSFRIRHGRIRASDYARTHVGFLLACLALAIAWGAALDPAEVIAGLHGPVDQASLTVRLPGSNVVAGVAVVTALISIAWAWRDRPTLIIAGWAALLISLTAGYFVIPGIVRASTEAPAGTAGTAGARDVGAWGAEFAQRRAALERVAFGVTDPDNRAPPAFSSGETALRTLPLWDPTHVGRAVTDSGERVFVALRAPGPGTNGAAWLVAPATGSVRFALETDSGLTVTSLPTAGPKPAFGPAFEGHLVTSPESIRATGIPLSGPWQRFAIAWTISWDLLRSDSQDRVLLWHRDVTGRLERLAPFARFGEPAPALLEGGALWWVSWGYVSHAAFPLVRPLAWRDGDVRYLRAGLIGAVHAVTGETHLWLAPGYDSLTASWARRFEPLIEPADRLPPDLRDQLAYPAETFKLAIAHLLRASTDSGGDDAGWTVRPREPFQLGGPPTVGGGGGGLWTAVALESGLLAPKRFVGLYAAALTARGPEQRLWRAPGPERLPGPLVGSPLLRPGQLRVWLVGDSILTLQSQMLEPLVVSNPSSPPPTLPPPRVAEVYVTLGGRSGRGLTARAALRGGEQIVTDTTLAARWQRVRRLAVQADSALGVGDLEAFSRLWRALISELAPIQRPR